MYPPLARDGSEQFFRGEFVGDEHVDELAGQTGADRLDLAVAAGDADHPRRFLQFLERYGDDPIVERSMHGRAVAIEESEGNVADGAALCEIAHFLVVKALPELASMTEG